MKTYAVYDTRYYEQCIGIFNSAQEIADYFNLSAPSVRSEMSRGHKLKHRYAVVRVDRKREIDE